MKIAKDAYRGVEGETLGNTPSTSQYLKHLKPNWFNRLTSLFWRCRNHFCISAWAGKTTETACSVPSMNGTSNRTHYWWTLWWTLSWHFVFVFQHERRETELFSDAFPYVQLENSCEPLAELDIHMKLRHRCGTSWKSSQMRPKNWKGRLRILFIVTKLQCTGRIRAEITFH